MERVHINTHICIVVVVMLVMPGRVVRVNDEADAGIPHVRRDCSGGPVYNARDGRDDEGASISGGPQNERKA